jgi:hypothetical protein
MGDADPDPVEAVRLAFAEACDGLPENATVLRAKAAVDQALATITAHARLIVEHERPRVAAVEAARAEAAAKRQAEAAAEASAKLERVRARKALQATLRGSKK